MGIGTLFYLGLYLYFYSIQDDRFISTPLPDDYRFDFKENVEELNFDVQDNGRINALLFKADRSKGIVCFWKGNGANLERWGSIAPRFMKYDLDVIVTDYRQHGKSKGNITLENFYSDAQAIYDFLKTRYPENKIVIVGYSLGTSIASHLSVSNNPRKTILIEPRERSHDKFLEAFFFPLPRINRFPFRTDLDIPKATSQVVIVAGTKSSLYNDAIRLKRILGEDDLFFEVLGADHDSILSSKELDTILGSLLAD